MIGRVVALAAAGLIALGGCQLVQVIDPAPMSCVTLQVGPVDGVPVTEDVLGDAVDTIEGRLRSAGTRTGMVSILVPDNLVEFQLPAGDVERRSTLLTQPGRLTFVPIPPEFNQVVVDGLPLPADIDPTPIFDGSGVIKAEASADELGKPAVSITLDAEAAELFDAYAAAHFGERFAIVMDGVVLSAPSINATEFNGQAQISGSFTIEEMHDLIAIVASGELPAPVQLVSVLDPVDGSC